MSDGLETNVRKYTEQLATDPKSRAFVPLADLYRQMGRYDEAIAVAREGLKNYPHYVAGKMALARALYENGDADEACALLDGVLITSPDNLLANRIMAEICIQRGEADRARVAIRRILAVDPADKHCTELLKSIEALVPASPKPVPPKPAAPPEPAAPAPFAPVPVKISPPAEAEVPVPPVNVRTATLAELYLRQGHAAEALEVYRELLVRDPDNGAYAQRARELGSRMAVKSAPQDPAVIKRKVLNTLLTRIGERRRSA